MPIRQYIFNKNSAVKIDVNYNPHSYVIDIIPTPASIGESIINFLAPLPMSCSGRMQIKFNNGAHISGDIATNAFIIDSMHSHPKGSGLGAVLVYEFAELARKAHVQDLGIYLVAGTTPTDLSPRGFYDKMGFGNTPASVRIQEDFSDLPAAQRKTMLDSAPMKGTVTTTANLAMTSWSKKWTQVM